MAVEVTTGNPASPTGIPFTVVLNWTVAVEEMTEPPSVAQAIRFCRLSAREQIFNALRIEQPQTGPLELRGFQR